MTISAAGFGYQMSWEDKQTPSGHEMTLKRSIEIVSTGLLTRLLCPKWLFEWAPTRNIREVRDGFAEFRVRSLCTGILWLSSTRRVQSYLAEMINERKLSDKKDEQRDLLSNFVAANEELLDDGEQKLGEVELVGTSSGFWLSVHLFTRPPFRKHVHVLHRWTRGKML